MGHGPWVWEPTPHFGAGLRAGDAAAPLEGQAAAFGGHGELDGPRFGGAGGVGVAPPRSSWVPSFTVSVLGGGFPY